MSYVSDLVATMAVPSMLQSKEKDASDSARTVGGASTSDGPAVRVDSTMQRIVERLSGATQSTDAKSAPELQTNIARGNPKYSMFVDAVQALRLDKSSAAELSPERVAQLKAAAREVFKITGEIPRDLRPSEVVEQQRTPKVENHAPVESRKADENAVASDNPPVIKDTERQPASVPETEVADRAAADDTDQSTFENTAAAPVPKSRIPENANSGDTRPDASAASTISGEASTVTSDSAPVQPVDVDPVSSRD